jgi:hypothetical protein
LIDSMSVRSPNEALFVQWFAVRDPRIGPERQRFLEKTSSTGQ